MTNIAEVAAYRHASSLVSAAAQNSIRSVMGATASADPTSAREMLLEYVPRVTSHYGTAMSSLTADWLSARPDIRIVIADPVPTGQVASQVRYLSGHLFNDPDKILDPLLVAADKYVKATGRATVVASAKASGLGWARIPSGGKTCAFCLMLASRQAAYASQRSALTTVDGDRYHGHCRCVAVPLTRTGQYPDGYDPGLYDRVYQKAFRASDGSPEDIAASIRRQFPHLVTDPVRSS